MDEPHDDRCPRCGSAFHCGMHDAAPCPCSTLTLSRDTLAMLKERYAGCLCLRCLVELAKPAASADAPSA